MSWMKVITINILITLGLLFIIEIFNLYGHLVMDALDPKFGWKLKENYTAQRTMHDFMGNSYEINFSTNSYGLRVYGSDSSEIKALVLGDSFTGGEFASNDKMWYASFAQMLKEDTGIEIQTLAGGASGWGTYQNLLLARDLSKSLKPDMFILQFC